MPITRELDKQAREDIHKSIDSIVDRYLSEGVTIYDLQRYFKMEKSFKTLLSDINYAGRRFFGDDEDYPGYVKKILKKVLLDKTSEVETKALSENTIKRFDQFLNEAAIVLDNDEITAEYLFTDLEYSEDDKDILADYFKTKPEYIDSKDPKYCVYAVTDFQADVLKNNRVALDVMILSQHQVDKMKENVIKKIVSGVFSQIPEQIDYMGIRVKPHSMMDKAKLKEDIEKLVGNQQILNLVTTVSKYSFVDKYGDENYYIWKKLNSMKNYKEFSKLYEFEENAKNPSAERVSFMDNLFNKMKEILTPVIPKQFKIEYDRGKKISVETDNKKDLSAGVKLDNDKIVISSNPIGKPAFEFNFNFQSANIDNIINTLISEFENSETNGLYDDRYDKKSIERDMPSFQGEENEDDEELETPITEKPKRIKRSIEIRIIRNVLEDAYILDDIELKEVTIDELIRRMLLESRKNKT